MEKRGYRLLSVAGSLMQDTVGDEVREELINLQREGRKESENRSSKELKNSKLIISDRFRVLHH